MYLNENVFYFPFIFSVQYCSFLLHFTWHPNKKTLTVAYLIPPEASPILEQNTEYPSNAYSYLNEKIDKSYAKEASWRRKCRRREADLWQETAETRQLSSLLLHHRPPLLCRFAFFPLFLFEQRRSFRYRRERVRERVVQETNSQRQHSHDQLMIMVMTDELRHFIRRTD